MTVDTLVVSPTKLPRVNLLPQEINEASAARRMKIGLGLVLVAVIGGVAYLVTSANASVTTAQESLDAAKTKTAKLQAEVAQHNTVGPLKADVLLRTQLLSTSMSANVPWAYSMNDMQLGLPRGARLVSWQMQLTPSTTPGGVPTTFGANGVASWAVTGEAKRYEDVALVIESLQQLDDVDSVFVTHAARALDQNSGQLLVTFTATARMNQKAIFPYNPKAVR